METIRPTAAVPVDCTPGQGTGYHPLEIAPFFRRFPRGAVRNFAYTFIWNAFFALIFLMINTASNGHLPSRRAAQLIFLVANVIGYTIHLFYLAGSLTGLEAAARRKGGFAQAAYFAIMPASGVMAGFWLAAATFGAPMRSWITDPDTAAAVMLMSREKADAVGLAPRAKILDQTTVGVDPVIMLTGPIPATRKLLERNNMSVGDIDLFEVNEAFAPVVAAWRRELEPDMDRVNVNGGAMALGHPLGSTGARLITTLLHEMERSDSEVGLVTMCCGGGLGTGTMLQRI